jgi:hypothetical protein
MCGYHTNATHADVVHYTTARELAMTCMLTVTCRAPAQSSHSQQKPTSLSSSARIGISRRLQQSTLTCGPEVLPEGMV